MKNYLFNTTISFKPCYKWNTFNTNWKIKHLLMIILVLNLVISGIPSILVDNDFYNIFCNSFKPCYKWNTFNTFFILKGGIK